MLDFQDVSDIVTQLDLDFEELRQDAKNRYELYRLRAEPYVDEEIAREGKMRMLSPMLMHSVESIRADLMMNPTEFTVVPLARERDSTISRTSTQRAENLERALATLWGQLNRNRRVDSNVIWHQLVSPFAIMMLEFCPFVAPAQPEGMSDEAYLALFEHYQANWLPWHLHLPDPMTCSWVERDNKPVIFARRYKMFIRDLTRAWSKNDLSKNPDKDLVFVEGKFKWVSDDYTRYGERPHNGEDEVEVIFLDDGETIYQAVIEPGENGKGTLLCSVPNPIGRPTGFIVPGNLTPDRSIADRYEPFLLPLMQANKQINELRSARATAARNLAGPRQYIPIDPEISKIMLQKGEKLPTEVRWKKNTTPYLLGVVENVKTELSQDWDKLEERIQTELERYLPSPFINIVDPAVVKSATATSILHAAESGMRMYGPLMSSYDAAIKDVMEAIVLSLTTYYPEETIKLYASGDEAAGGRKVQAGAFYRLSSSSVNFPYKLVVRTRGMSQAQAAAQYEAKLTQWILPDGSKGPATLDDLIEAANYTDPIAQRMKLAEQDILRSIDPWLQELAINSARNKIFLDSGQELPIGGQVPAAASEPSGMPNQAQQMASPLIAGPSGGSEAGAG